MCPPALTAAVSAAIIRPSFPPRIVTESVELGSVTTAVPDRKDTYLRKMSVQPRITHRESERWKGTQLDRGGVVLPTVEAGRKDGEGSVGQVAEREIGGADGAGLG